MILSVAMNPAIDKTLFVEELKLGATNRAVDVSRNIGGKGINVAKNARALGAEVTVVGFIGEKSRLVFEDYLSSLGIKYDFVVIPQVDVRENIKLIETSTGRLTEINEGGPEVSKQLFEVLKQRISQYSKRADVTVLSGSLPRGLSVSAYKEIITEIRENTKVILDVSGDVLKQGIEASPFMIKPNLQEFSQLLGKNFEEIGEIVAAARELIDEYGINVICVSMGARGSVTITSERAYYAEPLYIEDVKTPVGAGDALVAGFAYAFEKGLDIVDTIKIATATASASLILEDTGPIDLGVFRALLPRIKITEVRDKQ
ncbi:1-phosphofructokinase family hexose kinase [Thermococcus sp. 2319x1]|uniref:1-phosphofructokinase family hexose kinase n=1 Tax=Thermococcus sp. 2319x1 TaxID=1674923 RepID=UPI0015842845|nr:1-phosphofructokinase family hexose kinase [Thermococcus sp. 2319x1]